MTPDEIQLPEPDGVLVVGTQALRAYSSTTVQRLIAEAVAAEREACAELCEFWNSTHPERLAAEIRARGAKT